MQTPSSSADAWSGELEVQPRWTWRLPPFFHHALVVLALLPGIPIACLAGLYLALYVRPVAVHDAIPIATVAAGLVGGAASGVLGFLVVKRVPARCPLCYGGAFVRPVLGHRWIAWTYTCAGCGARGTASASASWETSHRRSR